MKQNTEISRKNSTDISKRLRVDVGRWGNKSSGLCQQQGPLL